MDMNEIAAMAPIPLTYPDDVIVPVRMQTEHLYALEQHLAAQGADADLVEQHFLPLHRYPPTFVSQWLEDVTAAYNQVAG